MGFVNMHPYQRFSLLPFIQSRTNVQLCCYFVVSKVVHLSQGGDQTLDSIACLFHVHWCALVSKACFSFTPGEVVKW